MEKFRKHHCWPKPTIGRIRTVRECDFMGGVGPIPVYPVTSTKAVFNEKNENLEDILNNGIKFQDSVWIKNLYTTKIAPYIADGDVAEGLSNIILDSAGNINMNMLGEGQVKFEAKDDKEIISISSNNDADNIYNMTISPMEIRIKNPDHNDVVISGYGRSELAYLRITELEDVTPKYLAAFDNNKNLGSIQLGDGLVFDEDNDRLELNIGKGLIYDNKALTLNLGEGLSFSTDGKLNCTVKGGSNSSSCSCNISDVKYNDANGAELFTFNDITKVYGPKITVKSQYTNGTYIGSVNDIDFYTPDSKVSVISEDLYSKEQIATISNIPIYGYKYFDVIAPRSGNLYKDGEWGKYGAPYKNNKILLNVESYYPDSDNDHTCRPIIFTQSQWTKDNPDSTQNCPFAYIGPSLLEVRADCGEITEEEAKLGASETYPDVFLKITPEKFYYNTKELCIPYQSSGTAIAQIAGKTIFAPNSLSSSITIENAEAGTPYKLASTNGTNIYKHEGITITDSNISANAFYQTSDERLKENIKDIEVPLEVLLRIPTVNFNFKDKNKLEMGTIAQEVEKICPEIINTDGYGYKSVDYSKLSILALKGLKDLTKRVNYLEKLIDKLV